MDSFAQFATVCPEEHVPLVRELMTYDALCEISCRLPRNENGRLVMDLAPSPLHWSRQGLLMADGDKAAVVWMRQENVNLAVLMIRWVKP